MRQDEDRRLSEALPVKTYKQLRADGWDFSVATQGPREGQYRLEAPDGRSVFAVTPKLAYLHFFPDEDAI